MVNGKVVKYWSRTHATRVLTNAIASRSGLGKSLACGVEVLVLADHLTTGQAWREIDEVSARCLLVEA